MTTPSSPENITFARQCSECNNGMNEGYCINSGTEYYCSDRCLHKHYTAKQWREIYNANSDSYWTTWEDKTDHQYKMVSGKLVEI